MKATGRAIFGVALCALAVVGYFAWWAKLPRLGEHEAPAWLLHALGIALAARAVARPPAGTLRADRFVAGLCLAVAIGIAGLFFALTRAEVYRLPAADAARLEPGRALPALALTAADGTRFDLAAEQRSGRLAGRKVVLATFRGFW